MQEGPWIYTTDPLNKYRYVLGISGRRMLAIIGANPSTANPQKPDRTVAKMMKIAAKHGYDGWVLCNLWPERETHPDHLRKRILTTVQQKNMHHLRDVLRNHPVSGIWAAWGNIIEKRSYLFRCLKDIEKMAPCRTLPWFQLGTPTLHGHPRHPLYQKDHESLIPFNLEKYMANYPG